MKVGQPTPCTHNSKRHGTTSLFAALDIATEGPKELDPDLYRAADVSVVPSVALEGLGSPPWKRSRAAHRRS